MAVSLEWVMVHMFKKGNLRVCSNYRWQSQYSASLRRSGARYQRWVHLLVKPEIQETPCSVCRGHGTLHQLFNHSRILKFPAGKGWHAHSRLDGLLPQVEFWVSRTFVHRWGERRAGNWEANWYWSVVMKRELSIKAKMPIYWSFTSLTITYGQELWVVNETMRQWKCTFSKGWLASILQIGYRVHCVESRQSVCSNFCVILQGSVSRVGDLSLNHQLSH